MLRGKKRQSPMVVPKMQFDLPARLHNRFDIEVVDAKTGEIKQRAQAENVICDGLWTKLLTPTTYFNYIHYGTGNGVPASTDTSLFTFLGWKTPAVLDDVYAESPENGYCYLTRKIILNPEDNVGETITELGIGYGMASSNLCTHAMLKDMNGNIISIQKTSTDLINVYATVYLHWDIADLRTKGIYLYPRIGYMLKALLGMYNVSGYDRLPSYAQCNYGVTRSRNYSTILTIAVAQTYSPAAKTITLTLARLAASQYNYGGLFAVNFFTYSSSSVLGGPALSLLADGKAWYSGATITGEAIGTGDGSAVDFKTLFPVPENAVIYIDGVAEANVTVDSTITTNEVGKYFCGLDSASTPSNLIFSANSGSLDGLMYTFDPCYYYYNPYYALGVASMLIKGIGIIEVSNDLSTWISLTVPYNSSGDVLMTIPGEYQNYKYWRITYGPSGNSDHHVGTVLAPSAFTGYNIHFVTPPAIGAVITADYTTKAIAKDANHVFDVSVVITLGEYLG